MGVFETKIVNLDFLMFLFWPQKYKDCHSLHNMTLVTLLLSPSTVPACLSSVMTPIAFSSRLFGANF
jgi:hypothetical protein